MRGTYLAVADNLWPAHIRADWANSLLVKFVPGDQNRRGASRDFG